MRVAAFDFDDHSDRDRAALNIIKPCMVYEEAGLTGEPVTCGILNSALFRALVEFRASTKIQKFRLEPMFFCLDIH